MEASMSKQRSVVRAVAALAAITAIQRLLAEER
jgi:hypothetical protein